MFSRKPNLMNENFDYYIFEVLPKMIVFEGEDLELAEANPADYIANQNNREQTTSLRIKAASIWAYVIKDEYRYFKP